MDRRKRRQPQVYEVWCSRHGQAGVPQVHVCQALQRVGLHREVCHQGQEADGGWESHQGNFGSLPYVPWQCQNLFSGGKLFGL